MGHRARHQARLGTPNFLNFQILVSDSKLGRSVPLDGGPQGPGQSTKWMGRGVAMKACETCQRVSIGVPFQNVSDLRAYFGLFFVYVPIVFLPAVIVTALMVYVHLRMMGARDIKPLKDFLPDWKSHRYRYKSQIVYRGGNKMAIWIRARLFWIFNCTLYCPLSVGLLEWTAYLVKLVENWWCPFAHGTKQTYGDASIDYSYWHTPETAQDLHPDDRNNPLWNQDAALTAGEPHEALRPLEWPERDNRRATRGG